MPFPAFGEEPTTIATEADASCTETDDRVAVREVPFPGTLTSPTPAFTLNDPSETEE